MFETNQSTPERVLRLLVSLVLLAAPFVISGKEPYTFTAAAIGGILLINAASGVCMNYKRFGVNTCKLQCLSCISGIRSSTNHRCRRI